MADIAGSTLVAEIEVGRPPIAFETSMEDIMVPEEENLIDDRKPIQIEHGNMYHPLGEGETPPEVEEEKKPGEEEEEEEEEEQKPLEEEEEEVSQYKDYSDAALVTEALKKRRPDIFGEAVEKDLQWDKFIEKIDTYIASTLEAGRDHLVDQTGQYKEYVDFLLNGGSPNVLKEALSNAKYSLLDIENAEDTELEGAVKAMYKDLGLADDEIESLVSGYKLSDKLQEKAKISVNHFTAKEKAQLENAKKQREQEELQRTAEREQLTSSINQIIDKGELMGLRLTAPEIKELKEVFFKPSEIREVPDGKGGKVTRKFTKYQVLEAEFKNNLEMQVAFGKLLVDGFKLSKIKEQGKQEGDQDFLDILSTRSGPTGRRRSTNENAYLTPAMEISVNK